jgi:predicted esterase
MLDAVIQSQALRTAGTPSSRAKGVVLLIHGRGATAESILALADAIALPDLCYVAPQADGYTWYPQSFMAPTVANEPSLSAALSRIAAIISGIRDAGIAPEKLAVIGFSQGACLASETVLRNPMGYGFIGILSGGAIGPPGTLRDYPGSLAGCRAFLGCAAHDAHIPLARVQETAHVFTRMGAHVTERIYPGSMHGVNDDEMAHLRQGLLPLSA